MKKTIYIFCFIFYGNISAQISLGNASKTGYDMGNGVAVRAVIVDGDTMPMVYLSQINISAERKFKTKKEEKIYWKIKRDVKKVYPYAILAEARLKEYNAKLSKMESEEERKKYMKKAEKQLKEEFEDELKKLTVNQGKILIKLIDRQTGETSYELVKTLRGDFSAFMWQSLATLFGSTLKAEYDAKEKDKLIEDVILLIESGEI